MASSIFQLFSVDATQVVLKVIAKDDSTLAMHPYIRPSYDYITVTRGENHTLSIVNNRCGVIHEFFWGIRGYTLITDDFKLLRQEVCRFIEDQGILLGVGACGVRHAYVSYHPEYKKWQLTINHNQVFYWSDTARSAEDMMREASRFLIVKGWEKQPGTEIWCAQRPIKQITPKCVK